MSSESYMWRLSSREGFLMDPETSGWAAKACRPIKTTWTCTTKASEAGNEPILIVHFVLWSAYEVVVRNGPLNPLSPVMTFSPGTKRYKHSMASRRLLV